MINLDLPWDIIENEGPGIYNEAYLADLRKKVLAAEKEGNLVKINFNYAKPAWAKDTKVEIDTYFDAAFNHAKRRLKIVKQSPNGY